MLQVTLCWSLVLLISTLSTLNAQQLLGFSKYGPRRRTGNNIRHKHICQPPLSCSTALQCCNHHVALHSPPGCSAFGAGVGWGLGEPGGSNSAPAGSAWSWQKRLARPPGWQNPPGKGLSIEGFVHRRVCRRALGLTSQPLCDFCHSFTPALIYPELEVALSHQVAIKWGLADPSREQGFREVPRGLQRGF